MEGYINAVANLEDEESTSQHLKDTNPNNVTQSKTEVNSTPRSSKNYWHLFPKILIYILHLCLLMYLGASVYLWHRQGDCDMAWCDGVGLLIILVSLFYFVLLYYRIIKRYLRETVHNNVFKPARASWLAFSKYWYIRWLIYALPGVAAMIYIVLDSLHETQRLISCIGMIVVLALGYIFSRHRSEIKWRPVIWGLYIQFVFGLITIRWPVGRNIFKCISDKVATFLEYSRVGARFVYGDQLIDAGVFAFQALSVIYFLSFIIQILYYYGIMQWIVVNLGWLLQKSMGTTACESINAAASIFLSIVIGIFNTILRCKEMKSESSLMCKPLLKDLTKSEFHAMMSSGCATVSGTVLAAFIGFGVQPLHLLTASIMAAPAALCYSKLFYPETEQSKTKADNLVIEKEEASGALDAATKGALMATNLILGIIANLIAFVSFIAFVNGILSWCGKLVGQEELTLEYILSQIFIPLAWVMGIEWEQCDKVAQLIGIKIVVNEFVAYQELGKMKAAKLLSARSEMVATYALCGFSNPGAIGISIGALATLAPERRSDITQVAFRAFFTGCATNLLTACIAGMLTSNDLLSDAIVTSTIPVFNSSSEYR